MRREHFFRNIGSISTFAFIGTAISFLSIGGIVYWVTQAVSHLNHFTFLDALNFGALISATDPVTTIAIFGDLQVDETLYSLVFGESVLNDAVALVLTKTLQDYAEQQANCEGDSCGFSASTFFIALGYFLLSFGGSFLVGSLVGVITCLLCTSPSPRDS